MPSLAGQLHVADGVEVDEEEEEEEEEEEDGVAAWMGLNFQNSFVLAWVFWKGKSMIYGDVSGYLAMKGG